MKTKFNLIVFLLVLTLVSCNQKNTFNDYKYADKGIVIECEQVNTKALLNEALFSFEDDITKFYNKGNQTNINTAYSQFIRNAIYNRVNYTDIVSPHTVKIFEALKEENSLWDAENPTSYLNYNGPIIKCIANKIQNKSLKTTLNALIETNSMSPKLFGAPLMTNYRSATTDKALAGYIALDLYYAKLFTVDLSNVKEKPEPKVDFNLRPQKPVTDSHGDESHSGHSH